VVRADVRRVRLRAGDDPTEQDSAFIAALDARLKAVSELQDDLARETLQATFLQQRMQSLHATVVAGLDWTPRTPLYPSPSHSSDPNAPQAIRVFAPENATGERAELMRVADADPGPFPTSNEHHVSSAWKYQGDLYLSPHPTHGSTPVPVPVLSAPSTGSRRPSDNDLRPAAPPDGKRPISRIGSRQHSTTSSGPPRASSPGKRVVASFSELRCAKPLAPGERRSHSPKAPPEGKASWQRGSASSAGSSDTVPGPAPAPAH
jgi:hypothetical protein